MKYFLYFLLFLVVLVVALIKPLSVDDFVQEDYYKQTSARIQTIDPTSDKVSHIKIGWDRINFTPPKASELAGYSGRGKYTSIKDSVFANCFFISSPKGNTLILNFDLILVHQTFSKALETELLTDKKLNIKNIYYTCSHSHSSYGGWAKGLLAKFALGGYNPEIVGFMVKQTKKMVYNAFSSVDEVEMAFTKINLKEMMLNRVNKKGAYDEFLRLLVLKNQKGEKAGLLTFSAHPTFMEMDDDFLSGDFAGMVAQNLIDSLNLSSLLYVSGAIGSTSPKPKQGYQRAINYAKKIADTIIPSYNLLEYQPITHFNYNETAIDLPPAQFKINNDIVLRPFWFQFVFGKPKAKISCLEMNQLKLIGISGEISGETFEQVKKPQNNIEYIPTSFNGDYIGYLTKGTYYYSRESAETRDMNLYGPTNSDYFVKIIGTFLNQID